MQILCILMPHFPLQCELQRQPSLKGCPVIITCASGSQRLVMDWSDGLKGIQSDMPLQQVISFHGAAGLIPAEMIYYSNAFERLLDVLEGISPMVEGIETGCVYLG